MQGESERQWKEVNENTYDISSKKRVTKKFSVADQDLQIRGGDSLKKKFFSALRTSVWSTK